ncbi:MAG TPA: exosome complex RNA-binding protein Rrp4 [Thermoplasmata archaeon]|nr:exosome complex RNA-binding protein Rrp4 [Thermoplasmata archaeon]
MGSRHRPGPERRGHGGASGPVGESRILVLPGEEIHAPGMKPGPGTYRTGGKLYASVLGLLQHRPPLVRVIPLSGRYLPKAGDRVIGTVADVQGTFWLLDIGAPRWAPLHHTGTPWKVEQGETEKYLGVGASVVVQVESLEATGRIGVTMLGEELGKLEGGALIKISAAKVPRVIGRGGSMIETLTRLTGCKIVVGQNGRVWVDGTADGIERVRRALEMIDTEGQRSGLTERVNSFLISTQELTEQGRPAELLGPPRLHPPHEEPLPPGVEPPPDEADEPGVPGPPDEY